MKALKIIGIIILLIIVIPLIIAFFLPKDYGVEKEITIAKPKVEVFDFIKYLKNQDQFSKWASMDTAMKRTYTGTDGTVGFISSWKSEKKDVGSGEQEIMAIKEGESIDFEVRFKEPFESKGQTYMNVERLNDSTTLVKWGFKGHMNYPFNVVLLIMNFDKMLGEDFSTGLTNLKTVLESPRENNR